MIINIVPFTSSPCPKCIIITRAVCKLISIVLVLKCYGRTVGRRFQPLYYVQY